MMLTIASAVQAAARQIDDLAGVACFPVFRKFDG